MDNKFINALKTAKAKQLGEVILKDVEPTIEEAIVAVNEEKKVSKPRKKKSDDN
jgi:hypothetical protein